MSVRHEATNPRAMIKMLTLTVTRSIARVSCINSTIASAGCFQKAVGIILSGYVSAGTETDSDFLSMIINFTFLLFIYVLVEQLECSDNR